ncbi:uncharacterized protein [Littorina saxatilis]|uniref:uncharacterized protein n=1 Tax=Littorina saxatilis TaxID=31220 RepID=UPI0038B4CA9D
MKLLLLLLIGLAASTAAPQQKRGFDLLGALGSVTTGTKMGTAIKVMDAFSKVQHLISDIKNLAPELHQALNASITDITNVMGDIIDEIGQAIDPDTKSKRGFDLLGALGSVTAGTKMGTAIKVMDAFSKVQHLISDIKNLAPELHQALNASITDITNVMGDIIDEIGQAIDPDTKSKRGFDLLGALGSVTTGTKMGTAIKVMDAFSKVQHLISDIKNLAPELHQALNASITDITNVMGDIIDEIGQAIDPDTKSKRGFDLLGALGSVTTGTKMGTAIKVMDAFSKVQHLISDIKNLAPELHQALNASITDITNVMGDIIDEIGQAIDPDTKSKRGFDLLGALGSVTAGTKMGTAIKVMDAFSKVQHLISDIKNLAPELHQALNASITDITNVMGDIIDEIGQAIDPDTKSKRGFDLLGALGSVTAGTKMGTAIKVMDAFSKVQHLISDIKNLAPELHQALNASITDITNVMGDIIDEIGQAIDPDTKSKRGFDLLGALGSVTAGTKMGTAIKVMDAFSKVQHLISDIKNLAPELHQALNASITDITNVMGDIIDEIGQAIDPDTKSKRGFDLLGALGSVTTGTKMGTAIKVMDAFSKVQHLISDIKNLAPELHQALNASITDITNVMGDIIDEIGQAIDPDTKSKRGFDLLGALGSVTTGTKMGTAIKVMDAFSKVQHLISDIKNLAPELHQALNASITDITNVMGDIIDEIGQAIDPDTKHR